MLYDTSLVCDFVLLSNYFLEDKHKPINYAKCNKTILT